MYIVLAVGTAAHITAARAADAARFERTPSSDRLSPIAKSAHGVSAPAKMFIYAASGAGSGRPPIVQASPNRVDSIIGLSTICFASKRIPAGGPRRPGP